jgi:alkylation response protein AidB-like acyl-CoA dehydrogenase
MTWFDAPLSEEQTEVVELANDWLASASDLDAADDAEAGSSVKASLVESGLWSIGMDEANGGGGAPLELRLAAFVALGASRPALAWASAQAHAAVEALGGSGADVTALIDDIVNGQTAVCVLERGAPGTRVEIADGQAQGSIDRIDPAGEGPALVILDGEDTVWLVPASSVGPLTPLRRTGLAGAFTSTVTVDGPVERRDDVPVASIRARLHRAGAAIAAGIAVDAAERSAAYSAQRVQFGGPLTALPTVRASLVTQSALARESVTEALDDGALAALAAMWSLHGNLERAITVAASSVQSHGGYGYIQEYGVERLLRDAVSLRAATDARTALRESFEMI